MKTRMCPACGDRPGRGKHGRSYCLICCRERRRIYKNHHRGAGLAVQRQFTTPKIPTLCERAAAQLPLFG